MSVPTAAKLDDLRPRLRFLLEQYAGDVARAAQAAGLRAQALRELGAAEAAIKKAEGEAEEFLRGGALNRKALADLFASATFVPLAENVDGQTTPTGGALYDDAGQVLRGLARDWTPEGAAARARSEEAVLARLAQCLGKAAPAARVLVPGCGLGRLAFEIAARLDCQVVASDESTAMLAALSGLLKHERMVLLPALHATAVNKDDNAGRFRQMTASVPDELLALKEQRVTLLHWDLTAETGHTDSFDAVVTLFVLDAVRSLPAAMKFIFRVLRPGGHWVNFGPLKQHRGASLWSFSDLPALAEAVGLEAVEDQRLQDFEYLPREVSLGVRELYEVQLFVARRKTHPAQPGAP